MTTPISPSLLAHAVVLTDREERVRHLPAEARTAFHRYQTGGDPATLDLVVHAILEDFIPRTPVRPLADLPGETRLIDDLGFDSLAITEVVFAAEDLFGITITNQEIIQVRSLADLRGFIRRKAAIRPLR
jgi:acyl carrier protein